MFLEVAYQAPLSTFSESIDQIHGKLPGLIAFSAVKRLASKVHSVISASFRRIVEKCLYCDFGCGNNFKSPALQQAFHRDVIEGLGELEGFFQKLQLDDQV
jgi:L-cysteine desulfidase